VLSGGVAALAVASILISCASVERAEFQITGTAIATGWNPQALDEAFRFADNLGSDTLLIVTNGQVVGALGSLDTPYQVHSIRKALLSALVGQHIGNGPNQINLDATLQDLEIDDEPDPLLPEQGQAKVLHLIKSVSGINRSAAAEAGLFEDKERRLGAAPNPPGSVWAYNNWDYNALTTVFEQQTGMSVAKAFDIGIAGPLRLQDYSQEFVTYDREPNLSRHAAAMFQLSARDLAQVGELYLAEGRWAGKQIVPTDWVRRITTDFSSTGDRGLKAGHGYLWWILGPEVGFPDGTFWASGLGRQALFVVPAWNTVIVHQANTRPLIEQALDMMRNDGTPLPQALRYVARQCLYPWKAVTTFCRRNRYILAHEFNRLIELIVAARGS